MNPNFKSRDKTDFIITTFSGNPSDTSMRDIERRDKAKGYLAIGVHFVITVEGDVEDGRDLRTTPAYMTEYNHDSVVICLVGTRDTGASPLQEQACVELVAALLEDYPNAQVLLHHLNISKRKPTQNEPSPVSELSD